MAELDGKHTNFVSRAIAIAEDALEIADDLDDLKREFDDLGLASGINPAAFEGDNRHVSLADLAAVGAFQQALQTLMNNGHRAALTKLKR